MTGTAGGHSVGSHRWFSPYGEAPWGLNGRVEVLAKVDRVESGAREAPLYFVRNIDTGVEGYAFGNELSTT